jgi:arylsulfatase A-like enzyme
MFPAAEMIEPVPGPEAVASMGYRMQWLMRLQKDGNADGEPGWRRYLSNYYGAIRMVDDQIARLMQYLRSSGLEEDTVVVFTADHGDYGMAYGLGRQGVGLPEPLTRIPMIWRGGKVKQAQRDEIHFVSLADVMPTLCEAMGAAIPQGVQGRSLWGLLRGDAKKGVAFRSVYSSAGVGGLYYEESDEIPVSISEDKADRRRWDTLNKVTQSGNQKMVRMGTWKLIFDMMGYGQMYDLSTDPQEGRNPFGHPSAALMQNRLMEELARWAMRIEDVWR